MNLKKISVFLLFLAMLVFLVTGCGSTPAPPPAETPAEPPAQNGSAPEEAVSLVENRCARCHTLDQVYVERDSQLWPGIVTRMVGLSPGLLNGDEYNLVVEYLQENYGN